MIKLVHHLTIIGTAIFPSNLISISSNFMKLMTLFGYFIFITIFIAHLGLFGLAPFIAKQKTKEIGIRKVLGSSVFQIVKLLTKEITILVLLANLIAWYISDIFLKRFAYRINLGFLDFAIPILAQFILAFLAVSFYTLKTAMSNPVEALKYE